MTEQGLTEDQQRGVLRIVHTYLRNRMVYQRKRLLALRENVRMGYMEPDEKDITETERKLTLVTEEYHRIDARMVETDNMGIESIFAAQRLRGDYQEGRSTEPPQ